LELQEVTFLEQLKNIETQEKAFIELIRRYKERLYWHIRKIVILHDDADDVLQNTFVKVFKNIDNFKGNSKLFSWMYRIATNEAISYLKIKAKLNLISDEELQGQLVNNLYADEYFNGDDIQLKFQKALATLPHKQRIVFNMKYFDNMKYKDISEILETSVGGLKASYHHARKKIEAYLLDETRK
jgi:RNA polymerase sigma-70 factor (ECF subfamily)